MPSACFDAVMYQRIGNRPKACPYVMMNRKLDSHPLRFMVCFFGGTVDGGGGTRIWGM